MADVTFLSGGLFDNVAKFADALGSDNAGIVLTLAQIPWKNVQDRNKFIESLTGIPVEADEVVGG